MNDEEFTAAFNSKPQVDDAFSQAFNIATGKQVAQVAPSPWEAYGVPKYPVQESALMRTGRGANIALTKAATGLKGLFADLSEEDIAKLATAPEEVLSYAYDIVINGYEAGGGSMRIYDQDLQNRIFEILGLSEKEIEYLFGFFIEALKYGTPPHGGIAFGLDRLTMILTGTDDIRDVIAFPKNLKGASLMSGEPSKVSNLQLDELYIKINTGKDGGEE